MSGMGYWTELRAHSRPLTAALIGLAFGYSFATYTTNIMAPHLIHEFSWSKAEFAMINGLSVVVAASFPIFGRLADLIGVRRTALIGVVALPITFSALSAINGDIRIYTALFLTQATLCTSTTSTVYSRIVVQHITHARGLALAIVASGPAVTVALVGPLLNHFVVTRGWREGYLALALFTAVTGAVALLVVPSERRSAEAAVALRARRGLEDYAAVARIPAFWAMAGALLLCNLPQVIALSQLNLVLIENGATAAALSAGISVFSTGTLLGRFACGLALDRFPPQIVAAIGMGLPSIGLLLMASSLDTTPILLLAVMLIGLSIGAEGDLVGFLVARTFGVRVYGSVLGLMTGVIATSTSLGAALLSLTLSLTETFVLYLTLSGIAVFTGSLLFLLLRRPGGEVAPASLQAP